MSEQTAVVRAVAAGGPHAGDVRVPGQRPADGMQGPTRRRVLQAALAAGAAASLLPSIGVRAAYAAGGAPATGDALVVLSLRGGVDGLSVVAPVGDQDYARLRPRTAVPVATALPVDRTFALHPSLAPLKPLWDRGVLGAVQAVGQPDLSRSHFRCAEELERAAFGTAVRTGWLDRALSTSPTGTAWQAVQLGSGTLSRQLLGPAPELAVGSLRDLDLWGSSWLGPGWATAVAALQDGADTAAGASASAALGVLATAPAVRAAAVADPTKGGPYPDTHLGWALRDVAALLKADVGAQVVCVDAGNWDMHERLGDAGGGWMADNLRDLAGSLAAFAADLGPLLDRTTLVTLTEFGRRVDENGSGGVDHGDAGCVLLLGGGVQGGRVHGRWPGLSPQALWSGGLAVTTDYRDVLTEVLRDRCGRSGLSTVFPGYAPTSLGVARPRP